MWLSSAAVYVDCRAEDKEDGVGAELMRELPLPVGFLKPKVAFEQKQGAVNIVDILPPHPAGGGATSSPRASAASGISDSGRLRQELSPEMVPYPPCAWRVKNRERGQMLRLKAWLLSVLCSGRKRKASWEASGHESQEVQQ